MSISPKLIIDLTSSVPWSPKWRSAWTKSIQKPFSSPLSKQFFYAVKSD